jgi:hypothetical protein
MPYEDGKVVSNLDSSKDHVFECIWYGGILNCSGPFLSESDLWGRAWYAMTRQKLGTTTTFE